MQEDFRPWEAKRQSREQEKGPLEGAKFRLSPDSQDSWICARAK